MIDSFNHYIMLIIILYSVYSFTTVTFLRHHHLPLLYKKEKKKKHDARTVQKPVLTIFLFLDAEAMWLLRNNGITRAILMPVVVLAIDESWSRQTGEEYCNVAGACCGLSSDKENHVARSSLTNRQRPKAAEDGAITDGAQPTMQPV
jgi:hypothetical protein